MYERRAHIRVPVGVEGTYQLLGDLSGPHLGITEDISLGGLRISSSSRLQIDDQVAVTLKLPEQGEVTVTGIVVWALESQQLNQPTFEAGLRWSGIDARAQARLNAVVTHYTHTRSDSSAVPSVGFQVSPSVRWHLSVAIALGIFTLVFGLVSQWIEHRSLVSEVASLRQAVSAYQELISAFPR